MVNGDKMSKSLKRVKTALRTAGFIDTVVETGTARTAAKAAEALGCEIDQIAKVEMEPKFEGRQMIMVLAPR